VKWIPNQASHGFWAWAEDLRGRKGALPLKRMRKRLRTRHSGYILLPPEKQNGNPCIHLDRNFHLVSWFQTNIPLVSVASGFIGFRKG